MSDSVNLTDFVDQLRLIRIVSVNDVLLIVVQHVLPPSVHVVLFHLFQLIGISGADKVSLHIVNVSIGVHEILLFLALDLDPAHDHVVLDVHALLLFLVARSILLLHIVVRVHEAFALWLLLLLLRVLVVLEYLLVLVLLLHLVRWRTPAHKATHHIIVVVVTLCLVILHLQQVVVLLL